MWQVALLEYLKPATPNPVEQSDDSVSPERGLEISADLFEAFTKSPEAVTAVLDSYKRNFMWGTDYLDENKKKQ